MWSPAPLLITGLMFPQQVSLSGLASRVAPGLGVSSLLLFDPGVRLAEQFGHRQQVVRIQAVGVLPSLIAILVAAARGHSVIVALVGGVPPDRHLKYAVADFVCEFGHGISFLIRIASLRPWDSDRTGHRRPRGAATSEKSRVPQGNGVGSFTRAAAGAASHIEDALRRPNRLKTISCIPSQKPRRRYHLRPLGKSGANLPVGCGVWTILAPKKENAMALDEEWITNLRYDELINGATILERMLREEREIVLERCRREMESIPEVVIETEDGIEIRMDERKNKFATEISQVCQEIPRILMNNMLVSAWSLFEGNFTGLASIRIHRKSSLSDEGFKASGKIREIKHAVDYFEQEQIPLPAGWELVDIIREIRNQIVHDGAIRHELDDVTDPIELTRHKRTVKIDKFVEEREAQGKKGIWYIHDGILCVNAAFCREVLEFLRDYVKAMRHLTYLPFDDEALLRRMEASDKRKGM